jgi:type II secretory pathway pseudopilin PulG
LVGLLVSIALMSSLLAAAFSGFSDVSARTFDQEIKSRANQQARALIDLIAFDLRRLGQGMPLGQSGFAMGGAGLGDASLPVLLTSTTTQLSYRLNEKGFYTMLTANYTPSASALTFSVQSLSDIEPGDTIYISDVTQGGTSGLKGVVTSASGTSVTIGANYVASAGAVLKAGSLVERVSTVVLDSPGTSTGITRNAELGALVLAPNSSFTLAYYDSAGAAVSLPLTSSTVANNLSAIRVTVTVNGDKPLRAGGTYSASVTETISLRNLLYTR